MEITTYCPLVTAPSSGRSPTPSDACYRKCGEVDVERETNGDRNRTASDQLST